MPVQRFGYHGTKNKEFRKKLKSSINKNLDDILEENKELFERLAIFEHRLFVINLQYSSSFVDIIISNKY